MIIIIIKVVRLMVIILVIIIRLLVITLVITHPGHIPLPSASLIYYAVL